MSASEYYEPVWSGKAFWPLTLWTWGEVQASVATKSNVHPNTNTNIIRYSRFGWIRINANSLNYSNNSHKSMIFLLFKKNGPNTNTILIFRINYSNIRIIRIDIRCNTGPGSCSTDCDCPLCSPFCSTSGYCQNHQRHGCVNNYPVAQINWLLGLFCFLCIMKYQLLTKCALSRWSPTYHPPPPPTFLEPLSLSCSHAHFVNAAAGSGFGSCWAVTVKPRAYFPIKGKFRNRKWVFWT